MKRYPRLRVTIELVDQGDSTVDHQLAIYSYDRGRIAGDMWLNDMTRRFEVTVDSAELFIGVGHEAGRCRSFAQMMELQKK